MEEQLKTDFEKTLETYKFSHDNIESRKKDLNVFIKEGFPNRRIEEWKFSDLSQIIKTNINKLKFFDERLKNSRKSTFPIDVNFKLFDHNKIYIVNGFVNSVNFEHEEMDKIIIEKNIKTNDLTKKNSLVSLNNAFVVNSLKITVKENYIFKKPLIIYNIINKQAESTVINEKVDLVLEKNSSIKIIYISDDYSDSNFINVNHQFKIGENAILKNYVLDYKDNLNIKYFYKNIDLGKNSIAENFILSCGSKFIKNEINCNLNDEYSSAFINGVINLNDSNHHEIKTNINHLSKNTKSYQLIKSVLNNKSKAVYQGKIYVNPKAQKTDGYQLSKAILLNDNTEFNAKPELEIYADDVKCSHGSASGSLNEDSIFYLMSRGLNYQEAKKLLINGFLLDVVEKITDPEIKNLIKNITSLKQ